MSIKKIIVTAMASATILGLGANVQPTIHARHVRISRVHRHRTYRYHKHYVQRNRENKRSKRTHHQRKHLTKRTHLHRNNHHYRSNKKSRKFRQERVRIMKKRRHNYWHMKKLRRASKHTHAIKRHRRKIRNKVGSSKKSNYNVNNSYDIGVHKIADILEKESDNTADKSTALMSAKDFMQTDLSSQGTTGDPQIDQVIEEYKHGPVPSSDQLHDSIPHTKLAPQTRYNKAVEKRILYDMNQDRASQGEGPLNVDPKLQHLAELRAPQLALDLSHYDENNDDMPYDDEDDDFNADASVENIYQEYNGGQSAKQMGDDTNDYLFNQEKPSASNPEGGGHYQNIMENNNVGIGCDNGNIAEEFN